ncbi:hypothetical protein JKF63_05296 [Porcisia hertigi]|uniref:Uncharacterized protein n=1 Tax=Porcisia hertigi TaxID=2761500 RepID=A0A836HZU0_9TRYP|nr:hypothetical protein JKF63_05296 [Porcisia hertigi]
MRVSSAGTAHRHTERRRGGNWKSSCRSRLSQLISAEQITRWRLRCEEQEERVEIALAKPPLRVLLPHTDVTAAYSLREERDERLGIGACSRPYLPLSEPVCAVSDEAHSLCAGRRWKKMEGGCSLRRSEGLQEPSSSEPRDTVSASVLAYVRDSELLRALQRAEARISELEAGTMPTTSASSDEKNGMNALSRTAKPQDSLHPGSLSPHVSLLPRLQAL